MKIKYNLEPFGIDTTQKQLYDSKGNQLSRLTLESILSLISSKYYYGKHEQVRINHKQFSNITNNYRQYLDFLVDKGIIFVNRKYKVGKYSRKYLFPDRFKEHATIKAIKISPEQESQSKENALQIEKWVLDRLQQDIRFVSIKEGAVEKEILFYKGQQQPIVKFKKYLSNEYNLLKLRQGRRDISIKAERLYTPFVQLSKKVRTEYFSFDDNHLTSLDIKRSFPLWLSVWLLENNIYIDYDTKEFLSSVKSGNFYNDLMVKFNRNRNLFNDTEFDRPFIDRNCAKDLFSNWLNGNPNKKNLHNYVMRACYPLIFDFVKNYKIGCKERMYYTLANMESDFILNKVCKRLYQEIPRIRLLTCHDEIYFEEQFTPLVEKIWSEELEMIHDRLSVAEEIDSDFEINDLDLELAEIYLD